MAGDPRWDLAWIDYYFSVYPLERRAFDMARFRTTYGTEHDPWDDVGRFYLLAILLFEKLLFFAPTSRRGKWAIRTVKDCSVVSSSPFSARVVAGRLDKRSGRSENAIKGQYGGWSTRWHSMHSSHIWRPWRHVQLKS